MSYWWNDREDYPRSWFLALVAVATCGILWALFGP